MFGILFSKSDLAFAFFFVVHAAAAHQFVKIHLMTVKVGAVDTGEFCLARRR
jgi:hypothetical protein